jgi:hypothetical protein
MLRQPSLADRTRVTVAAVTASHPQHRQDAADCGGDDELSAERPFHTAS